MIPKRPKNPHKPQRDFKSYLKFMMIAVVAMILIDNFLWGGERPYITKLKQEYYAQKAEQERQEQAAIEAFLPPKVVYPETGEPYFEALVGEPQDETIEPNTPTIIEGESVVYDVIEEPKKEETREKKPSFIPAKPVIEGKPKIAIVIDDVGMNIRQSLAAIALDPNVTLAFLPYAAKVKALSAQAIKNGNEVIIHTPMEAMNGNVDLGAMALRSDMNSRELTAEFQKMTESFDGYTGVNNHMGSRLTQDKNAMGQLMRLLKAKGLYFLDSKTISTSVAAEMAAFYGVPFAVRDVFLDHEDSRPFVANALAKTERVARRSGSAIAIGHPKANTMEGLRAWIPTLEEKGFELVPLSTLIQKGLPVPIQKVKEDVLEEEQPVTPVIKIQKPLQLDLSLPE